MSTAKAAFRYSHQVGSNGPWMGLELGAEIEDSSLDADQVMVVEAELTERLKMEVFRQLGVAFEFVDGIVIPIIPVADIPVARTTRRPRQDSTAGTDGARDAFLGLPTVTYDGITYTDTRSLKGTTFAASYPDFKATATGAPVWVTDKEGNATELGTALIAASA